MNAPPVAGAISQAPRAAGGWPLAVFVATPLLVVLVAWSQSVDPLPSYFEPEVPRGQVLYLFSKFAGLLGITLLWIQSLYGLLGARLRMSLGIDRGASFHRTFGALVLITLLLHWALFISGVTARTGHFPWQYVIPSFTHGFYRACVSVGICAFALVVLGASFAIGRSLLRSAWRWGHWLATAGLAAASVHGLLIGSESRSYPMSLLIMLMIGTWIGALGWRMAVPIVSRKT